MVQLNSLRALELHMHITSHSPIEWLNLPQTMPNLKTINILEFNCDSCEVRFGDYYSFPPHLILSPTIACFRAFLFNLHPGVPQNRLILSSNYGLISAEKLLLYCQLASEDQSSTAGQR